MCVASAIAVRECVLTCTGGRRGGSSFPAIVYRMAEIAPVRITSPGTEAKKIYYPYGQARNVQGPVSIILAFMLYRRLDPLAATAEKRLVLPADCKTITNPEAKVKPKYCQDWHFRVAKTLFQNANRRALQEGDASRKDQNPSLSPFLTATTVRR